MRAERPGRAVIPATRHARKHNTALLALLLLGDDAFHGGYGVSQSGAIHRTLPPKCFCWTENLS